MWRMPTEMSQPILRTLLFLCIVFTFWAGHSVPWAWAFAAAPALTCTSLTAVRSSDGSSYAFTAKASGNDGSITGYTFEFGDRQSYSFQFSKKANQDRSHATVSHTYLSHGVFTATVYVDTRKGGNPASASSPDCHTTVSNGPTTLIDTGAGNTLAVFTVTSTVGLVFSQIWLRRRHSRLT